MASMTCDLEFAYVKGRVAPGRFLTSAGYGTDVGAICLSVEIARKPGGTINAAAPGAVEWPKMHLRG